MDFSTINVNVVSMACDDVECLIELLSRRHDLLMLLHDRQRTKGELEAALGVSRSTVDRAVRALEERTIVSRGSGGVSLTQYGRVILDGYLQFRDGLMGLDAAKPLLSSFDADGMVPFDLFRDANVVTSSRESPQRPIVEFRQFLGDVSEVRSIITGVLPEYVQTCHKRVVEDGLTVEVVLGSSVLEKLLTRYWGAVRDMLSTDRFTMYEMSSVPSFSVQVGETDRREAAMLTYGESGVTGFIRSARPAAVAWAEMVFDRYRSDAALVAPME